jgi:hypothetical protein
MDDTVDTAVKIDPWNNRVNGMKCKSCMWFVPKKVLKKNPLYPMEEDPIYHLGRCRKHAPTINGYPAVFVNDWCGDHKLNENMIKE